MYAFPSMEKIGGGKVRSFGGKIFMADYIFGFVSDYA